jgi:hypothetical protein
MEKLKRHLPGIERPDVFFFEDWARAGSPSQSYSRLCLEPRTPQLQRAR